MTKKKTKEEVEDELRRLGRSTRMWVRYTADPELLRKKIKDSRRTIYRDSQNKK